MARVPACVAQKTRRTPRLRDPLQQLQVCTAGVTRITREPGAHTPKNPSKRGRGGRSPPPWIQNQGFGNSHIQRTLRSRPRKRVAESSMRAPFWTRSTFVLNIGLSWRFPTNTTRQTITPTATCTEPACVCSHVDYYEESHWLITNSY
eukprot:903819-Prorocentrum_minimum.AAC.2